MTDVECTAVICLALCCFFSPCIRNMRKYFYSNLW